MQKWHSTCAIVMGGRILEADNIFLVANREMEVQTVGLSCICDSCDVVLETLSHFCVKKKQNSGLIKIFPEPQWKSDFRSSSAWLRPWTLQCMCVQIWSIQWSRVMGNPSYPTDSIFYVSMNHKQQVFTRWMLRMTHSLYWSVQRNKLQLLIK